MDPHPHHGGGTLIYCTPVNTKTSIFTHKFCMVSKNPYLRARMTYVHSIFLKHKVGIMSFRMICGTQVSLTHPNFLGAH
eukprot:UN27149